MLREKFAELIYSRIEKKKKKKKKTLQITITSEKNELVFF